MGRGKIELLDTLLDQKLIGRLLWEHGNKLFRGVKQFFWFGRLINIMVFPAERHRKEVSLGDSTRICDFESCHL